MSCLGNIVTCVILRGLAALINGGAAGWRRYLTGVVDSTDDDRVVRI